MSLVHWYRAAGARVMSVFRLDWQVHFFWGLFLTLTGQFWPPLYLAGFLVTVGKEFLDLWSKRHWCWIDFTCGCAGVPCGPCVRLTSLSVRSRK